MRYLGSDGVTRIDPRFPEWLMGLPQGHVTGHGLRPAQELKLCGNGVVPQQAALALAMLT
jgi:DNA (cytosine-5)-methyltransferase 1